MRKPAVIVAVVIALIGGWLTNYTSFGGMTGWTGIPFRWAVYSDFIIGEADAMGNFKAKQDPWEIPIMLLDYAIWGGVSYCGGLLTNRLLNWKCRSDHN